MTTERYSVALWSASTMTAHISASNALRRSGRLSRIHRLESTESRTTLVVVEAGLLIGTPSIEVHGSAGLGTWEMRLARRIFSGPTHELYVIIVSIILARREVGSVRSGRRSRAGGRSGEEKAR